MHVVLSRTRNHSGYNYVNPAGGGTYHITFAWWRYITMADRRDKLPREECDVELSFLPIKLQKKLMPFQKEGVKFAIRKNGRYLACDIAK